MKSKLLVTILVLAVAGAIAVPAAWAGDDGKGKEAKEKPVSSRDMKKYDTNKDGTLSAEEKAARDADKEKAKAERKAKKEEKKATKEEKQM